MANDTEPDVEPPSYHGHPKRVRDPREDMTEPVPEPSREQRFYANGVGSVTRKLRKAETETTGHDFDEAISLVEDALEDLEKLQDGPDNDDE